MITSFCSLKWLCTFHTLLVMKCARHLRQHRRSGIRTDSGSLGLDMMEYRVPTTSGIPRKPPSHSSCEAVVASISMNLNYVTFVLDMPIHDFSSGSWKSRTRNATRWALSKRSTGPRGQKCVELELQLWWNLELSWSKVCIHHRTSPDFRIFRGLVTKNYPHPKWWLL